MIPQSTWRHFYRSLHSQSCILILGPHIATYKADEGDEKLLEGFSLQLAEELKFAKITFDESQLRDLAYIGLRWVKGQKRSTAMLRQEMCDFFDRTVSTIPMIYKTLAKLPFHLIINTSPDNYIYQAFQRAGKNAELRYYNYQRNQASLIPQISVELPLVFNLFGKIDDPESLVITKEDQVDFVNNLLKNVSTLPKEVLQYFDKQKTYLFLGFDANDWHLPLLLRGLRLHEEKEMSYYLHPKSLANYTEDFYTDVFDLQFIEEDVLQFANELSTGYEQWKEQELQRHSQAEAEDNTQQNRYIEAPQAGPSGKVNMLMLTANPKDTIPIELNTEIDIVEETHARATQRQQFFFKPILNTQKDRLLDLLLRHKPQIVHFSGHGTGKSGLLFYGENGSSEMVQGEELAMLFKQFSDQVSCVVLNACYSDEQALAIGRYIPNVIGTDNAIGDKLAIRFTEGFYTALFAGESYEKAYNLAMAHIGLQNFPAGGRPVFFKNGQKYIPA